ncbi:MAG: hypothetical protein JSS68_15635 [Actinobacteria bacterium]|nr:hypothetical protein [Actinomycetota bacterium]
MSLRHIPAVLIAAFTSLLVFASAATAETVAGETTTVESTTGIPSPEGTLVKASASYESAKGSVIVAVTTGAEPQLEVLNEEGHLERNSGGIDFDLVKMPVACSGASYKEFAERVAHEPSSFDPSTFSAAAFFSSYGDPTYLLGQMRGPPPVEFAVAKTVVGPTTTFSAETHPLVNQGFNCVLVMAGAGMGLTTMSFPLAPPPTTPEPAPTPRAPTAPAPPILSITTLKPFKLKVDKWKKVKVKVTNTGATATTPGALQVKVRAGVRVKPARQQLPILPAGGSFALSFRVELTKTAKKKSTLSLTASAPGASGATGSLALKLKQ